MSMLIQLLDRPIAYQPAFAQLRAGKIKSGPAAAVLLSQLVYWHNRMNGEWMYKTREDIKKETGLSRDEQETARKRLVALGVLEEQLRGVPATVHYRINSERLEMLLLSPDRAESQMAATPPTRWRQSRQLDGGNPANQMVETPPTSRVDPRQQAGGDPANFPTGDYTENTQEITQERKPPREENNSVDNFSVSVPEKDPPDATEDSILATEEDFDLAIWFWSTIIEMYERAAEYDGELAKPKEPNFVEWANEVRLLRQEHGCNHDQIRNMVERAQRSQWWCKKVQTPEELRDQWTKVVIELCSGNITTRHDPFGASFKTDKGIPKGFRG